MLSFEQKLAILDSFPQLRRKHVSLGRVNYHYEESARDKKTVAYHLHPNGNGFVYGGLLQGYRTDEKGFVNVRDFSEDELRAVVEQSIRSLSAAPDVRGEASRQPKRERWIGPNKHVLEARFEDDLWYVYAGLNLDAAFETYDELETYMREEGYSRMAAD
ncbi:hypothetical protein [Paenibacillus sp. GYB003]|uniref:hypothetical protein n=1 Tax=Paenibacillus sp. GYB003 TaxID=2994392 RepID=UPI002F968E05